jgi:hypothetical protein
VGVERGPSVEFREGLEGLVPKVTTAEELSDIPRRLRVMAGREERGGGEGFGEVRQVGVRGLSRSVLSSMSL